MYAGIRDNHAILISENGRTLIRRIGHKNAASAQANKVHSVVLYRNGVVRQYSSQTGSDKGRVGRDGAININLQGDYLVISYDGGRWSRFNLRKRAYAAKSDG